MPRLPSPALPHGPRRPCSRRQWLAWCAALATLPWVRPGAARTITSALQVLLIGNSHYQHSPALDNPSRDVQLLAQVFSARGARVTTHHDLSAQGLLQAVEAFLRSTRPSDALWIGYSGHAVQIDGRNYLQGVDSRFSAPGEVRSSGVNLDLLLRMVSRHAPLGAVLSIDACRNNPFEPERTRSPVQGLAVQEPQGLCISFSTAPYTRAYDGDVGQYSPYAQALAQALQGTQRKSLDAVLQHTANQVYAQTRQRQVPEYRSALRSQWWFEADHIALHADTPQHRPAVQSRNTRAGENSYRPDQPSATGQTPPLSQPQWDAKREQLLQRLMFMNERDIDKLLEQTDTPPPADDALSAALYLLEYRHNVASAPAQARTLLEPLAQQGDALAQNLLAESAFAEANYAEAYKWFSLAARAGYSPTLLPDAHQEHSATSAEGSLFGFGTKERPAPPSPRMRLKKAMAGQR